MYTLHDISFTTWKMPLFLLNAAQIDEGILVICIAKVKIVEMLDLIKVAPSVIHVLNFQWLVTYPPYSRSTRKYAL